MMPMTDPSVEKLQAKIAELSQQLDAEKLDANRYRWLRDKAGNTNGTRPVVVLVDAADQLVGGEVLLAYRDRKQLDNFIDRFTTVDDVSLLGVHSEEDVFEDDLPVAVVIDAGRDGRVLCELQAYLPPVDTQIFARRKISQVFDTPEQPRTLTFTAGLPGSMADSCVFLLDDGSIHAGAIIRNSKAFPAGALSTTNPAGGLHEIFDIPLHRVKGWANAGPTDRIRSNRLR